MEHLRKAIDAVMEKEPSGFKEAIRLELMSRLGESLDAARSALASTIVEVNVGAPSAPPSTLPSKKMVAPQSPAAGVENEPPSGVDEDLMKEIQAIFGMGAKAEAEKPTAKDDDISLDPNFEKEYLNKSFKVGAHKVQFKQIGLGLSKPIRVYVDGERWELFPGPEAANKAVKEYIKELEAEAQATEKQKGT
jgi:hypothetical protein